MGRGNDRRRIHGTVWIWRRGSAEVVLRRRISVDRDWSISGVPVLVRAGIRARGLVVRRQRGARRRSQRVCGRGSRRNALVQNCPLKLHPLQTPFRLHDPELQLVVVPLDVFDFTLEVFVFRLILDIFGACSNANRVCRARTAGGGRGRLLGDLRGRVGGSGGGMAGHGRM